MKNHTSFLAIAILCILAFSACTGETLTGTQTMQPQENQQGLTTGGAVTGLPNGTTPNLTTTGTVDILPLKDDVVKPESETGRASDMSLEDSSYLQAALQYMDSSYCEKIKDVDIGKECVNAVTDKKNMQDAVVEMNPEKCAVLSSKDNQDICKVQIEIARNELTKVEQENNQVSNNEKLLVEAVDKQDIAICDSIARDPIKTSECKDKVFTIKAALAQDKTICNQVADTTAKELCLTNIE